MCSFLYEDLLPTEKHFYSHSKSVSNDRFLGAADSVDPHSQPDDSRSRSRIRESTGALLLGEGNTDVNEGARFPENSRHPTRPSRRYAWHELCFDVCPMGKQRHQTETVRGSGLVATDASKALPRLALLLSLTFGLVGILGRPASAEPGDRYVPPITSAILNESPQITTEIRPIYMYHWIPKRFVTGGGYASVVAVQLRAAINERLAFIATKDGYADIHFNSVLPDEEGFANVAAGLKYLAVSDPSTQTYVAVGGRYEAPVGDIKSGGIKMQGGGDGFVDIFTSASTVVGDQIGLQGSAGLDLALDDDRDSSFFHASVHADAETIENLFAVVELNVISTIDEAERTPSGAVGSFEGMDLINFGSTRSGTVATLGLGGRFRLSDHLQLGVAYEVPVTSRHDIMSRRITVDLVFEP